MNVEVGSVFEFYAASAGKKKFHLCVAVFIAGGASHGFLFLNSKDGYKDDLAVADGTISGLPRSPTGKTVVSCSLLSRLTPENLRLFNAKQIGSVSKSFADQLAKHIQNTTSLTPSEKKQIVSSLLAFSKP